MAFGAMVFWGVSFVATRAALDAFHPLALIATRLWLGGGLLVVIQALRGRPLLPEPEDRGRCLLLGLVNALHLGLQAFGLLHTTAIRTGWIIAVIPVAIALGGQVFLRKRLAPIGWLGALVATAGVFVVTVQKPAELANARFGDLLQLVSCVTWTIYTLASAKPVA
jgi:drug/metabolite transporter (DMT)-like permease